jgi:2-polyprenyl-3-methyl-5-hydroxy-6-metoxy-1,4-benzoquinol methylase
MARPDTPLPLEACACPLCGDAPPERTRESFPPHRVVDCPRCGLRYLTPRVAADDLPRLYERPEYWEGGGTEAGYESYAAMEPLLLRTFAARLAVLPRPLPGARLLDVGCGPGAGLEAARRAGWEAYGLDVSSPAISLARQRHGDRARIGTVEDRLFPDAFFDAITLYDLIEHVYAPRRFAEALAAQLRPGGSLLIATPNCRSLLSRLTGRRWVSYKIPEHVLFFSPSTLAEALRPWFRTERVRACGQWVSLPFLFHRLGAAAPAGGALLTRLASLRGLSGFSLYANSGSMLVLATRVA